MSASDIEDVYRLTLTQQGMLFECLADQDSGVYIAQMSSVLPTELDADALREAAAAVAARHSALRTSFVWEGVPEPVQVVRHSPTIPVREVDLRGVVDPAAIAEAVATESSRDRRSLDLRSGRLSTLSIIREPKQTRLVATFHHLALDRWSVDRVLDEITIFYRARVGGEPVDLADVAQFGDFVAWLAAQDLTEAEHYWREALAGVEGTTPAPAGTCSSDTGSESLRVDLPVELHNELRAFVRRHGLTTFTVIEGAWALVLGGSARRRDVVFGVAVAGRPVDLDGAEAIVGMCMNTVPVRVDVGSDQPVSAWLHAIQRRQAEQRKYEHVSLPLIHRWSAVPAGVPIFESVLTAHSQAADSTDQGDAIESSSFPLSMNVQVTNNESAVWFAYHRARYQRAEIERIARVFVEVIGALIADPDRGVAAVPIALGAKEGAELVASPGEAKPKPAVAFMPPVSECEQVLARIFAEVLEVEQVGLDDDFVLLGGDSIHSLRIVTKAARLGWGLRPQDVFKHPTVRALAELVAASQAGPVDSPPQKAHPGIDDRDVAGIVGTFMQDVEDFYGLAPSQREILVHSLVTEGHAYVAQAGIEVEDVDVGAFERAVAATIRAHPVLRTCFRWDGASRPVQLVLRRLAPPVRVVDADAGDPEALQAVLESERAGLSLERGPLLRFVLLRDNGVIRRIVVTQHHIILDHWSNQIVLRDLQAAYEAELAGQGACIDSPMPFRDYIDWLDRVDLEAARRHWTEVLADFDSPQELRVHPGVDGGDFGVAALDVAPEVATRLRSFARQHGLTMNTVFSGAWAVVLAQVTGTRDVVFGSAVSGRPPELDGVEAMVGMFASVIPTRIAVRESDGFVPWLRAIQDVSLASQSHYQLPVSELRRLSAVPAGRSLFETVVATSNTSIRRDDPHNPTRHTPNVTDFAVALLPDVGPDEMRLTMFHHPARVSAAGASSLLSSMHDVLSQIADGQAATVEDLVLPSPARSESPAVGRADTVVGLVGERIRIAPDAVAVEDGDGALTYGELEEQATRLASLLRARGVGTDDVVGVALDRSTTFVVAALAVLKAGAGYLPLDPTLPIDRRRAMVIAAGARVVLGDARASGLADCGCTVVDIESPPEHPEGTSSLPLQQPRSLAYVMFTSGSTGEPKGVMVEHAQLADYIRWLQIWAPIGPRDRVLLHSSVGFDLSAQEIFWTLAAGATIVVAPRAHYFDPCELTERISAGGATVLIVVPAALRRLLDVPDADLRSLRLVLVGGEPLTGALAARVADATGAAVKNIYGPTETHVVTGCDVTALAAADTPSIGWARTGSWAPVLDDELTPAAANALGEIHLGGACVGRGYLGRPAETADRFVPDPFAVSPGGRLYRTGDLARLRTDGSIEFVGRLDHQVKVRGHRVEPGEIEAALVAHDSVDAAVVLPRDENEETSLIAYVVSRCAVRQEALHAHLGERLPRFMIPREFVVLSELPVNSNGKVDRLALLRSESAPRTPAEETGELPDGPVEEILAAVWCEVLGLDAVGRHDDFLELGGDSLRCLDVVSGARAAGLEISPRDVFEAPTVAELAVLAVPVPDADVGHSPQGKIGLTPGQRALLGRNPRDPHHLNASFALRALPDLDLDALDAAVQAVVAHHDGLRIRIDVESGEASIVDPADSAVHLEVVDEEHADLDALQGTLDLETGPVVRVVAIRKDGVVDRVLFIVHHVAVDVHSIRVLIGDITLAYRQASDRDAIELPPIAASLGQCVDLLGSRARSPETASRLGHWCTVKRSITSIPLDHPGGSNTFADERWHEIAVSIDGALRQRVASSTGATLEDVALTGAAHVIASWTGSETVAITVMHNGRVELLDVDASRTLGFFNVNYPLQIDAGTHRPLCSVVSEVTAARRDGVPWAATYEQLRWLGEPSVREQLDTPDPDVVFNFLGSFAAGPAMAPWTELIDEGNGPLRSPRADRPTVLAVVAYATDEALILRWGYSVGLHEPSTIEGLAEQHAQAVQALIEGLQDQRLGAGLTPHAALSGHK